MEPLALGLSAPHPRQVAGEDQRDPREAFVRDQDIGPLPEREQGKPLGRRVSGDARVNYDYNSAYQAYSELDLLSVAAANVGDDEAAARYAALRDRVPALSPLLAAPYFDPATGALNVSRYESDVYLVCLL